MTRREEGLTAAFQRNLPRRRGGRASRATTRGIHRGILQVLRERIVFILQYLVVGTSSHQIYSSRIAQIDERLEHLQDNWVEDKFVVLPNLKDFASLAPGLEPESESEVETVFAQSEPEEISDQEEADRRPVFSVPAFQQAFERLLQRGGPRLATSSASSSSVPAPASVETPSVAKPSSKPPPLLIPPSKGTPKQKAAPKATSFLAPTSKAKPESRVVLGKPASVPAIASGRVVPTVILEPVPKAPQVDLNILVAQDLGVLPAGAELFGLSRRLSFQPIISLDYHNVLDKAVLSRTRVLRLDSAGQIDQRVQAAVGALLGSPFQILVCSYCHEEETRQRVRTACVDNPNWNATLISDKPTGPKGKLACLSQVISDRCLSSRPSRVYHVDDSYDVLKELKDYSGIIPVGVRVKRRNYWEVEGVWYGDNIFAALEHILELEQPYLR